MDVHNAAIKMLAHVMRSVRCAHHGYAGMLKQADSDSDSEKGDIEAIY